MSLRNTADRYGAIGQFLHWSVVLGIIASYFLAEAAEDEETGSLLDLHTSVGIAILALAILRIGWRLVDRTPSWPQTMAGYERVLARATHALLYVLLFAVPVTGWLIASAEGDPATFFGLFELPPLPVHDAEEDVFEDLHETLFNVLVAVAALHIVGALKHHFWNRDHVLRSMLPTGGTSRSQR